MPLNMNRNGAGDSPENGMTPKQSILSFPVLTEIVLGAVRARRKSVALVFALAIPSALAIAGLLGKRNWEATGTLLYTPLPMPEAQKGLYTPPDMQTLVSLLKSPPLLNGVIDDFELTVPTTLLDKLFKVTAPRTTQTVTVSLQWAEGATAERMVDDLMQRFIELVHKQRTARLNLYVEDYDARLQMGGEKFRKASETYNRFLKTHSLSDAKLEAEALQRELVSLRDSKVTVGRNEQAILAQKERLMAEIEEIKHKVTSEDAEDKQFEAAQETVADNRRRQDRLRELIEDEKKRTELMAELTVRRKEYERLAKLRVTGAVSQQELDEVGKNVEMLSVRLNDTENVRKWKEELTNIDSAVIPKGKARGTGSPIIQQTLFRKLEFDLQLIGLQKDLFEIEKGMAKVMRRQEEIRSLTLQSDNLLKEMESFENDRNRLAEQLALFQRLRDQKSGEFTVVSPALAGPFPVSSTRKIWMAVGFVGTFSMGLAAVVRLHYRQLVREGRFLSLGSGFPELPRANPGDAESVRRLATAIRRWLPDFGATLVWVEYPGADDSDELLASLAKVLHARGESVLFLNLQPRPSHTVPETHAVVEFPSDWTEDTLADPETSDIFENARRAFSIVIVRAVETRETSKLELLDQYADGFAFYAYQKSVPATWNLELRELDATLAAPKRIAALKVADPAASPPPPSPGPTFKSAGTTSHAAPVIKKRLNTRTSVLEFKPVASEPAHTVE